MSLSLSRLKYSLTAGAAGKKLCLPTSPFPFRLQVPTVNCCPQHVFWELVKNVLKSQQKMYYWSLPVKTISLHMGVNVHVNSPQPSSNS